MKINEKNLCAYSITSTHIDKEGYMLKKGEINKSFQKRWFVLKGNLLFYFEKKTDKEPVGVIVLEGCTIELADCEDQYAFKIVFYGCGSRTYVLAAESQESLESWMKCLARASYDYLKLMVTELQKQLDELNETEMFGAEASNENSASRIRPPPRRRRNPFNKPESDVTYTDLWDAGPSISSHLESSTSPQNLQPTRKAPEPPSKCKSVCNLFVQLHSEYGVHILKDKEHLEKKLKINKTADIVPNIKPDGIVDTLIVNDLITF